MPTLGPQNSNINIDGAETSFTDFGGNDTYTILPNLSANVTITDNQASTINLPEGLEIADAKFSANGVLFTVNGFTVTFIGDPASFSFVFGGTPINPAAGTAKTFEDTAAAFGTSIPAPGSPLNTATKTGPVTETGVGPAGSEPTPPTPVDPDAGDKVNESLAVDIDVSHIAENGNGTVTFTFSEAVTNLGAENTVSSSFGFFSNFQTVDGVTWTATLTQGDFDLDGLGTINVVLSQIITENGETGVGGVNSDEFTVNTSSEAGGDTTAPILTSLEIPSSVDLSNGDAVFEVAAQANDDLTGVNELVIWFDNDITYSFSSGDRFHSASLLGLFSQPDWADGTSKQDFVISKFNTPGTYNIDRVTVEDIAGNQRTYTPEQLQLIGVDTSIEFV